ncbi:hypothetical protein BBG19_1751 (plasmid) [Francisella sp. MA067296]|nr:hypothetical protein BBG19_1751 [Francisella sp. MA067296]
MIKSNLDNVLLLVLINSLFWLNDLNIKHLATLQNINLILLFVILILIGANKVHARKYK